MCIGEFVCQLFWRAVFFLIIEWNVNEK